MPVLVAYAYGVIPYHLWKTDGFRLREPDDAASAIEENLDNEEGEERTAGERLT